MLSTMEWAKHFDAEDAASDMTAMDLDLSMGGITMDLNMGMAEDSLLATPGAEVDDDPCPSPPQSAAISVCRSVPVPSSSIQFHHSHQDSYTPLSFADPPLASTLVPETPSSPPIADSCLLSSAYSPFSSLSALAGSPSSTLGNDTPATSRSVSPSSLSLDTSSASSSSSLLVTRKVVIRNDHINNANHSTIVNNNNTCATIDTTVLQQENEPWATAAGQPAPLLPLSLAVDLMQMPTSTNSMPIATISGASLLALAHGHSPLVAIESIVVPSSSMPQPDHAAKERDATASTAAASASSPSSSVTQPQGQEQQPQQDAHQQEQEQLQHHHHHPLQQQKQPPPPPPPPILDPSMSSSPTSTHSKPSSSTKSIATLSSSATTATSTSKSAPRLSTRCALTKPHRATKAPMGNRRQTWGTMALAVLQKAGCKAAKSKNSSSSKLLVGMTVDEVFRKMTEWNLQPASQGSTPKHTLNLALHMMAKSDPPLVVLDSRSSPHRFMLA